MIDFTEYRTTEKIVLAIRGDLVMDNVAAFRQLLDLITSSSLLPVELDLKKVNFVDSSGLGALLGVIYDSKKQRRKVTIHRANPVLNHILSTYQRRYEHGTAKVTSIR